MVCVPCIFLPILAAIYIKFIQPFILRMLPERWATFLDPILYPTCPVKIPPPMKKEGEGEEKMEEEEKREGCCPVKAGGDDKKDL
ncbi:hypothetical protein PRIPAC_87974 [Pristionchus pacificus]|nr:hypothetical protein PRIPAC_87974 [Pristionchus pacificus]